MSPRCLHQWGWRTKLFSNNTRYQFSRTYSYFFEIRLVLCVFCSMRMGRSLWLVWIYSTFPENSGWRRNYEVLFRNSIHACTTFSMHLCIGVSSTCGFKNAIFSGWRKGLMLTLQTLQFAFFSFHRQQLVMNMKEKLKRMLHRKVIREIAVELY